MSSPTFEVIADAATLNLVMVEGTSMSSALSFADLETSAAENWSGASRVDMYVYSGSVVFMQLSSSGISGASGTLTLTTSGVVRFNKQSGGPAAGTWPYTMELTWNDGTVDTLIPPALLKVVPRNEGTFGND
jgi:hypothetical protein